MISPSSFIVGTIIGSMIDPIAWLLCGGLGALSKRIWLAPIVGYVAYIPLAALGFNASGMNLIVSYLLIKCIAGAILALIGFGIAAFFRRRKLGSPEKSS